jgi:hypothetical protein
VVIVICLDRAPAWLRALNEAVENPGAPHHLQNISLISYQFIAHLSFSKPRNVVTSVLYKCSVLDKEDDDKKKKETKLS